MNRVGVLFPSFYYLFAKKMIDEGKLPFKIVIFLETGEMNYGLNPSDFNSDTYKMFKVGKGNFEKILYIFRKRL